MSKGGVGPERNRVDAGGWEVAGSGGTGDPAGPSPRPEAPMRPDGTPGIPVDMALVDGRVPGTEAEQVPDLDAVDCPDDLRERIEELMSRYPDRHSASIPALWAIQSRYGWCTPEGILQAAAVMRVTPAYLESVASFYDLLRTEPSGDHRVLVCTNISCWMRGGDELLDAFCEASGADLERAGHGGSLSADGDVLVSGFECLGACELAPMASIDERYYGPLEATEAVTAFEQLRNGEPVLPERSLAERGISGGVDTNDHDERLANKKGPNR